MEVAEPDEARSATAPVIPFVKPTVAFVTPANVAAVATAVASETVTVLASPRTTFVPDVTRAAVASAAVPVTVCAFATVTVPVVEPPIADRFAAVTVPVASVTEIFTSGSSPTTAVKSAETDPLVSRSEIAPLIPFSNDTASVVELTKAAASASVGTVGSDVSSEPPPHAARGIRRSGDRPFLFFDAAFNHLLKNLFRPTPTGIVIASTSAPCELKASISALFS